MIILPPSARRRFLRVAITVAAAGASLLPPNPARAQVPTGWSLVSATDGGTTALGSSLATTERVAAVGAPFAVAGSAGPAVGAVFVYVKAGGAWTSQELTAPTPVAGADFGTSVAVSGNLIAIGAGGTPRSAYVFAADAGAYESVETWADPASDTNASFGSSVAVFAGPDGTNYVAVAAPPEGANAAGVVYVSRQVDGGPWSKPPLALSVPSAQSFGIAVAFASNGALLVGDPDTAAGQVFVYTSEADGGWAGAGTLPLSPAGWNVQQFGNGIATWNDLAIVTAPGTADDAGAYNGAAFVFASSDAGVWTQQAILTGTPAESFANFAPAIQGGLVAIGSAINTASSGAGQVDVWAASGGGWVAVPSTALSGDSYYGQAVGIVGGALFVGDTSALGASAIGEVTSVLFIEAAQYLDGGALDGGTSEGGVAEGGDASAAVDGSVAPLDGSVAATPDGSAEDAGTTAAPGSSGGGCNCTASGAGADPGALALLSEGALAVLVWRRRRRALQRNG